MRSILIVLLGWGLWSATWAIGPMDSYNSLVAGGTPSGYKDGLFATARFDQPEGLALDEKAQILYVADSDNHRIRTIDLARGNQVGTLAGTGQLGHQDGSFDQTTFEKPSRLVYLPDNQLVVYDSGARSIRLLDLKSHKTSTLLRKIDLRDIAYQTTDEKLYWTDPDKGLLIAMDLKKAEPQTVLSQDERLPSPDHLCSMSGDLYITDRNSSTVYVFSAPDLSAKKELRTRFDKVGEGKDILALAYSDGAVYALQSGVVPLVKFIQGKAQPVSLATVWGFTEDPADQRGFERLLNMTQDHPVGFVAATQKRKFFISGAAQAYQGIISVKDYDFANYWLSSSEPDGGRANDFNYPAEKPEGIYRILLVGDSRTYIAPAREEGSEYGDKWFYGAPRTATMGKQLELMLNTEAALKGSKNRFEVLEWNRKGLALSTYAPYEIPPLVVKYKIDLVLALTGHTGFQDYFMKPMKDGIPVQDVDTEYLLKPLSERVPVGAAADLYARYKKKVTSNTEKLAYPGADRSDWGFSIWEDPEMKDDVMEMAGRRLEILDEKMKAMSQSGWAPHLALFFVPFRPWPDYIQPFWKELADHHQWSFLDLTEPYETLRVSYYPAATACCDGHYTAYGSYLIGYLLAHYLVEGQLVPMERGNDRRF